MAITRVGVMANPPTNIGDYTHILAHLDAYAKQVGNQGMLLTQWGNASGVPAIAKGSYISHGGTLFVVDTEDFLVAAPASNGTYYLRVAGSGASLAISWVTSIGGYTWNAIYNGLYDGSENQILPYQLEVSGTVTVFSKRKITNLMQGAGFVTVNYLGAVQSSSLTGMVVAFALSSAPIGWLGCDGSAVSRSTYSKLFASIGTTFGVGNGSTTFNLPDLRGEFVRGFDDGRGVDSGRVLGSAQTDLIKEHTHSYTGTDSTSWYNVATVTPSQSLLQSSKTSGITGGIETRPRNIALLYCIKY